MPPAHFPGKRVFEWAFVLPLAMPPYVVASAYPDFLQFSGPLQTGLRALFGWQVRGYWFPEVRSASGAGLLFALLHRGRHPDPLVAGG